MSNPFVKAMEKILKLVVKHQSFLEKNPKVLAKMMQEYDDLHYASRHHPNEKLHDWNNLKYDVIDLEDQVGSQYASLVYDSWAATLFQYEDWEPKTALEKKKNKTMDEIVKMCLDLKYRYNSMYPSRKSVLDYYLCCIGTGLGWNKEGFIGPKEGPSGTDMNIFEDYDKEEIPEKILKSFTWLKDPDIELGRKTMWQDRKDHFKKKEQEREHFKNIEKALMSELPEFKKLDEVKNTPYYPLSEDYSLICNIPKNVDPSFVKAAKEICNAILNNQEESMSNKKIAKKILKKLEGKKKI